MVVEQVQLHRQLGHIGIDVCDVALSGQFLIHKQGLLAAVVVLTVFIGLLQAAQHAVNEGGLILAQCQTHNVHGHAVAHFVIAQCLDLCQSFLGQANLGSSLGEGLGVVVVSQCGEQFLHGQLVEDDLQLLLVGAVGCVECLDGFNHLSSDSGVALCQDHSHHNSVSVVLGEVHHQGAFVIASDDNTVALTSDFLHVGEVGSNSNSVCQSCSQLSQFCIVLAADNQLQSALLSDLAGADGNIDDISFGIVIHNNLPGGSSEIIGSQDAVGLQSGLQLGEVGHVCNQYIYQFCQLRCADAAQNSVDGSVQTVAAGQDAQRVVHIQIEQGLAVHSHGGSAVIVGNCQLGSDVQSQVDQVILGSDLTSLDQVQGDEYVIALLDDGEVLVSNHTVYLLVAGSQVCSYICIVLTAQDGQVLAGNSAGDVGICAVVAVDNVASAAVSGDAAVNGLAVQIQNNALVQGQSNRILGSAHIVQQDHSIALSHSGQIVSGEHCHSIVNIQCLGSCCVHRHCHVLAIQVLHISLEGQVQAGAVLSDQVGQLGSSHAGGQLHCVHLTLQAIQHSADGQAVQIHVGNAGIAGIAEVLALQSGLQCADQTVADCILTAGQSDGVGQGLAGDVAVDGIDDHVDQVANSHFGVELVNIVDVSLANHGQRAHIGGVHSVGQISDDLNHAATQCEFHATLLSQCDCLSGGLQGSTGAGQSDVEGKRCFVVEGHGGLQQSAALLAAVATIDDQLSGDGQIADHIAVLVDQSQHTIGIDAGTQHCVYQCLQVVLAVVHQGCVAQLDAAAAAAEQAQCEVHDAVFNVGHIQRQDHDVAFLRILDQGNAQRVGSVDQSGLLHVDLSAGDGDLAVSQHIQYLSGAEVVLVCTSHFATNGVLIDVANLRMCGQLDLAAVNGDGTQFLAVHVDGIFLSSPGNFDGLRTGDQILITGHGADVVLLHLGSQAGFQSQRSDSAFQFGTIQVGAGSHGPGDVANHDAVEVYINNNRRVARRGAGYGLYPSHFGGNSGVLCNFSAHQAMECAQQVAQCSLGVLADNHGIVINGVLAVELVSLFQSCLCRLEAPIILGGQQAHQLIVFNHQLQQIIQFVDLGQVGYFVDVEIINAIDTGSLVSIQGHGDRQHAVGFDQCCQADCCICSGIQEALAGIAGQSSNRSEQLRHGVGAQGSFNCIVVVDLLQVAQLTGQTLQSFVLLLILCSQLIGNVHNLQQFSIGNAQSCSGQIQFVVHVSHLEAFGGVVDAADQGDGGGIQATAVRSPLQLAHTGNHGLCLDDHLTGNFIEVDLQVLVLGNNDAEAVTLCNGIALVDVLQSSVHIGVGLNYQGGQVLLFGHCANLTGDLKVRTHLDHQALIQVLNAGNGVNILAACIGVSGQGHLVAIGNCGGHAVTGIEAFTVGDVDHLGRIADNIGQVSSQRKVLSQHIGSADIICFRDQTFPLCQCSSIGAQGSDGFHHFLLVGILTQGDNSGLVVGQCDGLSGVHQQGVDHSSLHHNTHVEHTHVVADSSGGNIQLFLQSHRSGLQVLCVGGQQIIVHSLGGVHNSGGLPIVCIDLGINRLQGLAQLLHNKDQHIQHCLVFLGSLSLRIQFCTQGGQLCLQLLQQRNCGVHLLQGSLTVFQHLDIGLSVVHEILGLQPYFFQVSLGIIRLLLGKELAFAGNLVDSGINSLEVFILLDLDEVDHHRGEAHSEQFCSHLLLQNRIGIITFQESNCIVDLVGSGNGFAGVTQSSQSVVQFIQLILASGLQIVDQIGQLLFAGNGVAQAIITDHLIDHIEDNSVAFTQILQQQLQLAGNCTQAVAVIAQVVQIVIVGVQRSLQCVAVNHQPLQVAVRSVIHHQVLGQIQVVVGGLLIQQSAGSILSLAALHVQIISAQAVAGQIQLILSGQTMDHIHGRLAVEHLGHHEHQCQGRRQGSLLAQSLFHQVTDLCHLGCIGLTCCCKDVSSVQHLQHVNIRSQLLTGFQQSLLLILGSGDLQLVGSFHGELIVRSGICTNKQVAFLCKRQVIMAGDHTLGILQIKAHRNPGVALAVFISRDSDLLVVFVHFDEAAVSDFFGRQDIGIAFIRAQPAGADDRFLLCRQLVVAQDQLAERSAAYRFGRCGISNQLSDRLHVTGRQDHNHCQKHRYAALHSLEKGFHESVPPNLFCRLSFHLPACSLPPPQLPQA